jgi:hypothetical protein
MAKFDDAVNKVIATPAGLVIGVVLLAVGLISLSGKGLTLPNISMIGGAGVVFYRWWHLRNKSN